MILTFWSSSHGQGVTFTSIIAASALAKKGRTLLIDADFLSPSILNYLGVETENRLEELFPFMAGGTFTSEILQGNLFRKGAISVLPPLGYKKLAYEDDTARYFWNLLQIAKKEYDYIIIDAGSGLDHAGSYVALKEGDAIVVTLLPNFLSAKNFLSIQEGVEEVLPGVLHSPKAYLLLNRWEKKILALQEEVADYCGLPLLGALPEDHVNLMNTINKGDFWRYVHQGISGMMGEMLQKILKERGKTDVEA